jgi:prolyl-tRNA editing enzyme YbaK/EbsC (Cys-tRNA(Pro) deacylase)
MSHASVLADLSARAPDLEIIVTEQSTATVIEAAATLGVEPGRIAKTIALRVTGEVLLLVTRGDARLDNAKSKAAFGGRPRMLVCCDASLNDFDIVYPAAGSLTSSVKVTPARLAELTGARWVDACVRAAD